MGSNHWLATRDYDSAGAPHIFSWMGRLRTLLCLLSGDGFRRFITDAILAYPYKDLLYKRISLSLFFPLLSAVAGFATAILYVHMFYSEPKYVSNGRRLGDVRLGSLEIERVASWGDGLKRLDKHIRGSVVLYHIWNDSSDSHASARRIHGRVEVEPFLAVYVPVPREGKPKEFKELSESGSIHDLQLHLVFMPKSWTTHEVELHKTYWAVRCRVSLEMVDRWSSFRDLRNRSVLENGCRPGGVCVVVSRGDCESGTFDDLP
jgi:hypothetical protein